LLWEFFRDTYNGLKLGSSTEGKEAYCVSEHSVFMNDMNDISQCRVVRKMGHETIVNFIGPWIPWNNYNEDFPLYCATMLALLVPWRTIGAIHHNSASLEDEFHNFMQNATLDQLTFIKNVQYFYESSDRVQQHKKDGQPIEAVRAEDMVLDDSDEQLAYAENFEELMVMEDDIEYAIEHPFGPDKTGFAQVRMNIAADVGIFSEDNINLQPDVFRKEISQVAGYDDI
jgi:hypothetical protein